MNVRKIEMGDVQDLFDIYEKSGKQKRPLNMYPVMDWILQSSMVFLIAETSKGHKAGFIAVREKGDFAGIDLLIVNKRSKIDEVRRVLINEALKTMKARRLEVRVPKKDAMTKFLKANGFEKMDEIKGMYGPRKDGVILSKAKQEPSKKLLRKKPAKPEVLKENLKKLEKIHGDEFGPDMLTDF